MTETHATPAPDPPVFPPGRYGRRREPRRRRPLLTGLLVTALAGTLTLLAFRLYREYGDPDYTAEVVTYTPVADAAMLVEFRVTVPPGGSAVCVVRVRARDGAEVGREEVRTTARPDARHVRVQHRLDTTARPFIAEVPRCRPAQTGR